MVKNREKTPKEIHELCKKAVTLDEIHAIEGAKGPIAAMTSLCSHAPEKACAILDRMSPMGAAFVLGVLRMQVNDDSRAAEIVKLAETLNLKAERFCQVRDEVFKRTGVCLP